MSTLKIPALLNEEANKKLKDEFTSRMGKRLKEVRKQKKMSQQEIAEKAGLHLTYVSHLELGRYHPTVFVVWKIAKALGVGMDELTDI